MGSAAGIEGAAGGAEDLLPSFVPRPEKRFGQYRKNEAFSMNILQI